MVKNVTLDQIVSLCKRCGFVYPTSEIYGGLASSYDYGPLGTELLRNIKNSFWRYFVTNRSDIVGLDSQIILHPKTWEASGHTTGFVEPVVEDTITKRRYRADHLVEDFVKGKEKFKDFVVEELDTKGLDGFIKAHNIKSPDGNTLSVSKFFNTLVETKLGVLEGKKNIAYLRGETAQGIFSNFKNVIDSTRIRLPFGIAQIGKSFRNEITKGQFVFRTVEFEQAEIEYFFNPGESRWKDLYKDWQDQMLRFVTEILGVDKNNLTWRRHTDRERSHYSRETYDLDYRFPFGYKELWGIAYRTDFDLKSHAKYTGVDFSYTDLISGRKFIPHVIEPAVGINRVFLMILCDSYKKDVKNKRLYLSLKPFLAPYKVAVFPLVRNNKEIVKKSREVFNNLKGHFSAIFDDRGNIGKRYFAQDEVGTPWCVTIDYDSLKDNTVTIRDRDTTKQKRIKISELKNFVLFNI